MNLPDLLERNEGKTLEFKRDLSSPEGVLKAANTAGVYRMFLSFVPGIFTDWNHPREIAHLTSKDGVKWDTVGQVDLQSDRLIDAAVIQLPRQRLAHVVQRRAQAEGTLLRRQSRPRALGAPGQRHHRPQRRRPESLPPEGQVLAGSRHLCSSADWINWKPQEKTLLGNHGDIVVSGDRAWWFYFTPGRRTSISVVELSVSDGKLIAGDPAKPTYIDLEPEREAER